MGINEVIREATVFRSVLMFIYLTNILKKYVQLLNILLTTVYLSIVVFAFTSLH